MARASATNGGMPAVRRRSAGWAAPLFRALGYITRLGDGPKRSDRLHSSPYLYRVSCDINSRTIVVSRLIDSVQLHAAF